MLPKDPIILLSTVNTKLRDYHDTLEDLALSHDTTAESIADQLSKVNYFYDADLNQFK